MIITNENNGELRNIDAQQLTQYLSGVGLQEDSFVILSQGDEQYIQAAGTQAQGYVIEYREHSETEHYTSLRNNIPHSEMVTIFLAYFQNANWKNQLEWSKLFEGSTAEDGKQNGMNMGKLLLLIAVLVALFVWIISVYIKNA